MRVLELNNDEMNKLLQYKRLKVDYGELTSLEIYEDTLTFNDNGEIFILHSANLEFHRQDNNPLWMSQDLKNLVCNHLNLNQNEVVLHSHFPEEIVFKVRIIPERELILIVCPQNIAISNSCELYESNKIEKCEQIGLYRQLGDSYYYFRWADEV